MNHVISYAMRYEWNQVKYNKIFVGSSSVIDSVMTSSYYHLLSPNTYNPTKPTQQKNTLFTDKYTEPEQKPKFSRMLPKINMILSNSDIFLWFRARHISVEDGMDQWPCLSWLRTQKTLEYSQNKEMPAGLELVSESYCRARWRESSGDTTCELLMSYVPRGGGTTRCQVPNKKY